MKRFFLGSLIVALICVLPIGIVVAGPLEEADKVYDQGGIDNIKASIDLYQKAVAADPNSYEAAWKCARAHRNYGDEAKKANVQGWEDICAEYGKKAMGFAQKATAPAGASDLLIIWLFGGIAVYVVGVGLYLPCRVILRRIGRARRRRSGQVYRGLLQDAQHLQLRHTKS